MTDSIYLDNNATTSIDPDVAQAIHECLLANHKNPASQHRSGQRARAILEDARERIAALLNVDITTPSGDRLIFVSGGTEANNLAVQGLGHPRRNNRSLFISSIEHPSVLEPARALSQRDTVQLIDANDRGQVDLHQLEACLKKSDARSTVVAVMMANHETGVVQPIEQITEICRGRNRPIEVHTDAVQAIGKIPVDFQQLPVGTLSLSAHKFHGPVGIGALAVRKGVSVDPMLFGGGQQLKTRPGTESVALAVGMAVALEKAVASLSERTVQMAALRDQFEHRILESLRDVVVIGGSSDRLPNTSNMAFLHVDRQALLMALDFAGVECSTGSACESGSSEPSHVLRSMGLSAAVVASALRFSLSSFTTRTEVDQAASRIINAVNGLRQT